jgi:predicted transcriptional regulator
MMHGFTLLVRKPEVMTGSTFMPEQRWMCSNYCEHGRMLHLVLRLKWVELYLHSLLGELGMVLSLSTSSLYIYHGRMIVI